MLKVNDPGVDGPLLVMVVISILKGESSSSKGGGVGPNCIEKESVTLCHHCNVKSKTIKINKFKQKLC